jgi:hypothetical protein
MMSKTILSYQGPLTFNTIDLLLTRFKFAAQEREIDFRLYKKLISVMIEALENVTKYSDQFNCDRDLESEYCPSFRISQNDKFIELVTSNPVRNNDIKMLKSKIDRVNNKSRDQLKELYKLTITNGQFTSMGGAGLGFIEMAKTSGSNLNYDFKRVSENYSIYTFKVRFDLRTS